MCFDGGATGRYRVPRFGQDRSLRRSNFGRTGPQADVDVQAVGGCRLLRGRARRVICAPGRERRNKKTKSEEDLHPLLDPPPCQKMGEELFGRPPLWRKMGEELENLTRGQRGESEV